MAPGRIFCMSGPVAHVDDDDDNKEQVRQAAHQYDGAHSSQIFRNDTEKASFTVSTDDPKTRQSLGEIFIFNGDIYVGSLQGFLPDGMGKYLWSDGCMYEGEWSRGKKNGRGKMSWPSGDTYEGSFSSGYMHGMGTYTGADGTSYKGNWKMNEKHGFGSKNYTNGDSYEGSWKRGVPEGLGRYIWKNGSEYVGDWKGGVMSGRGILSWGTGDTFDGHWLEGMQHGHGVYTWADGSSFVGNWSRGLKDGRGIFYPPGVSESMTFHERIRCRGNHDLSGNDLIVDTFFHQQQISSQSDNEQFGIKNRRKSNYISSAEKLKLAEPPIDDSISHIPSLARPWKSIGGSLEKVSPFEFVDTICEAVRHREIDNRSYVLEEQETAVSPIVEREYVHGVLINEFVFESLTSSLVKPLKRWHRRHVKELKRPGETIYKGHRSYDLMLKLQLGIRYTVGRITPESKRDICPADFGPKARIWMNFPREGSQLTPPHQSTDFKWKDYCPVVFRHLREMFKIDAADYMLSICGDDGLRELSSPGKSGSVFYLSNDDRFIIKTIRKYEVKSLLEMLAKYYKHVRSNENTLVTKFFGLHRIKPAGGHKVHFVVMGNMFCPELCIHRRFDLKGSSQGRSTDKVEIDETTTLKDLDLDFVFHLEPSWRDALLRQIEFDCKFLEYERIMDYSLLLGVHFRGSQFPAVFSPTRCPTASNLPCSRVVPPQPSDFERLIVEELASKSLVLVAHEPGQDGSTSGSHVRGSPLRASVAPTGDEEVDLLLPGTARRLRIQLGVNMPARAERKLHQKNDSHPEELSFGEVYDVVLYLGIIDILQEYDIGKKIEHAYKVFQFDASSISAVDPCLYAKRFQDFIQQVFPATPSKA